MEGRNPRAVYENEGVKLYPAPEIVEPAEDRWRRVDSRRGLLLPCAPAPGRPKEAPDGTRTDSLVRLPEDGIGIRLRDVIGADNMIFLQSRKILAEILAGVPEDEQVKLVGANTARLYRFDVTRLGSPTS